MNGEPKDPLRYMPDFDLLSQDPSGFILGENPSHDDDSMAQYSRSQMSVGLRNELIINYSEGNIFKVLEEAMVDEIRQVGRGARVLTIGAGSGHMEFSVAKQTWHLRPEMYATDLYPHFHKFQTMAEDRGFSFLKYLQMDARQLDFPNEYFDISDAPFTVYHILGEQGGPEAAVSELKRVTARNGKTRIATRGPRHMSQLWERWLPGVADYMSQNSLITYAPPRTWYPNCDLERTGWLLDQIYGNKRVIYREVSPVQLDLPNSSSETAQGAYIRIPATPEGWRDIQWIIHALQHNFRPVPPEGPTLTEAIEAVVKPEFDEIAARNGGYYPLEIEQAVFESIKR